MWLRHADSAVKIPQNEDKFGTVECFAESIMLAVNVAKK